MANPYTTMRQNIEYALETHEGLQALEPTLRKWDDEGAQRVDNPAADRTTWLRVETVGLVAEPFWSNGKALTTQHVQLVAALPAQAGLKQEDIEELFYQIMKALTPLTRDQMQTEVAAFQRFTFSGGDIALAESAQPNRQDTLGNLLWSQVAKIEITFEELISELMA